MYFPVAEIDVPLWVPPLAAFVVSFFTSMGGVSGAFLLLPFQMSVLGYTSPSVSATNQLFNVVAIPSGVYRYFREGRMVWPLTWIVVAGTLPGVFIGAWVRVTWLPGAGAFQLFAAAVLFYIGLKMVRNLHRDGSINPKADSERRFRELARNNNPDTPKVRVVSLSWNRICYEFHGERHQFSTPGVLALSFAVGIVGGTYGIGGGSIIAPFFVTVFGLPIYTVAGAALMGTFVTSVAGVAFYQALAPFYPTMTVAPDWLLGALFGLGGTVGIYLGARCQKHVPARAIKWMLAIIVLGTALRYVMKYVS